MVRSTGRQTDQVTKEYLMERIAAACSDYVASSSQMRVEQASKEGGKRKESGVGVGGARIEAIEKKKKR